MPLEPRVGKILIYGALLGCIDPALTIAAAMSLSRSPFLTPHERRQEAATARADFVRDRSDHLALLRAYEAWELEYEL
jgi:ATP-dependent RNA helicase DHX36